MHMGFGNTGLRGQSSSSQPLHKLTRNYVCYILCHSTLVYSMLDYIILYYSISYYLQNESVVTLAITIRSH